MIKTRTRLQEIADRIAGDRAIRAAGDWDDLRERVEIATGGDLDCVQLDIVTDMVAKRRGFPANPA